MICAKTIIRNSVLLGSALILGGCSFFNDQTPINQISYTNLPPPLEMKQVQWQILEVNGYNFYALDASNFSNLALDMQLAQDRLYLYQQILENQNKLVDNQ